MNNKKIKKALIDLDMEQKEFADLVGVHAVTMSRWLNGKQPITPNNEKLLEYVLKEKISEKRLK